MEGNNAVECNKSVETIRDVKGNDEDGDCGDNDHNNNQSVETNLSTSPPRKEQCVVISSSSSKPDNEGLHGSEPDLVGGTIGATSKDVTTQKQGIGETQKQPLDTVQDQMTEETYFYSGSGSGSGSGSYSYSESDSDSDSDNDSVLSHTNEDRWFASCDCHCDNRKIYLVVLEKRINSKSECKEYLKKIGCDSKRQLLGGSKASPCWFYARLSKKEVAKLAREGGVRSVSSNFFFP